MSNVKPLFDCIPAIPFTPKTEDASEPHFIIENESQSAINWVSRNEEIGLQGEALVKGYLERKYRASVEKQPDYKGFDFRVDIRGRVYSVEVKTACTENHIYISINEMLSAQRLRGNYFIYFISEFDGHKGKLHIINDPYESLHFEHFISNIYCDNAIESSTNSVRIIFRDMSDFFEIQDFESYQI